MEEVLKYMIFNIICIFLGLLKLDLKKQRVELLHIFIHIHKKMFIT